MHDLRHDPQTGSVLNHFAAKDGALRNGYDCRPADERTATDIASLRADIARLNDEMHYLRTTVSRLSDTVQTLMLRGAP